jgi:carbon storage regulator CsrA
MLVLTRCLEEEIIITPPSGEKIVVIVLAAGHGRCRLGIEAPKTVEVCRDNAVDKKPRKS